MRFHRRLTTGHPRIVHFFGDARQDVLTPTTRYLSTNREVQIMVIKNGRQKRQRFWLINPISKCL